VNVYLRMAGHIQYSRSIGYGARCVEVCKRVPKPVRKLLEQHPHSEVTYDAQQREAKLVPLWDRHHGW